LAVNKRKVLDAARKYAQKGAKEKALKEYHTLLKLDPRDAKLHLEIGDCYRRWGQIDEAITQYARVADQYKDDGFDARSVAVFKQILNLDPKRYTAYVSLAELYQRMGLDSEALGALQAAADGYHKEGDKPAALELLRKMATLDPTNTTSRLKVAELLRQEGMEDDAVAEYKEVVVELDRQGAREQTLPVLERILELRPEDPGVLLDVARRLIETRKPERAEPFARKSVEIDPENADAREILIDIYKDLGEDEKLADNTRALAKMYRERGDQDKARELAQRIPLSLEMDADEAVAKPGIDETESAFLSDDELLDDDFLAADSSESRDVSQELPLAADDELELELDDEAGPDELILDDEDGGLEPDAAASQDDDASDEPLPEGDPDQLLAEASVYLRYGKRDQAIASLQAVLQQEPNHRAALERLGDAYAEGGDDVPAVAVWTRAAQQAAAEGDSEGFTVLRDRIAALDAGAADALEPPSADAALEDSEPESEFEIDIDADGGEPEAEDEFEIDVSVGEDEEESAEASAPAEEIVVDDEEDDDEEEDGEFEIDIDVDADGLDEDEAAEDEEEDEAEAEEPMAAAGESASAGSSSTTSQQVAEDLEEAEFYFQQELFDEAEAIYRRILKIAPNHPSALLRLGELAAAQGGDPSTASEPASDAPIEAAAEAAETPEADGGDAAEDEEVEFDLGLDEDDDEAEEAPSVGEDSTEVAELGLDLDEDDEPAVQIDVPPASSRADETMPLDAMSDAADEEPDDDSDEEDGDTVDIDVDEEEVADEPDAEVAEEPLAAAADDDDEDGGGFDLAAELRDVIEEDDDPNGESQSGLSTVEDGFESIFADFKQGVSATLSEDDYETRYDLGIAYREMELYDDAIGEFRMCLDSPSWKLGSLHMMGLCALDLGRAQDATNHLEQALATPDLPPEQQAGLQFDLGRALEVVGDLDRARSAYEAALAADPELPGVQERLDSLGDSPAAGVEMAEDGGESFESFDDLVAEAQDEDDDDTEQTESFESFDDVITEAEAEPVASPAETVLEVEEIAEPLEEPDSAETPDASPKKRKKKISFV
jgi:tetratricopeptide (TPR) repeat protein